MFAIFFYSRNISKATCNFSLFLLLLFYTGIADAQTFVFAQLTGSPVSTNGWNIQGAATVGNVTGTGNSEIILCPNQYTSSGAVFYNQAINLSLCNKWAAEFDFRIFDGDNADGMAFCFLDTPPSGFVTGGGLGIPSTANGLKVCFDTYPNCPSQSFSNVPKIELRWGAGYNECLSQPTIDNLSGTLSFIRSASYNHAKITYDNGTINVYVNNILYLSGFQQFNFAGYLGFTAGTGGNRDTHSIKNVIIYTDMPPSDAGNDQSICSGSPLQVGTSNNTAYVYTWSPATGVDNIKSSNPTITLTNNSTADITKKFYVQTAFNNAAGCASKDSISIIVRASLPALSISSSATTICRGTAATFTAAPVNGGTAPSYQWKLNGATVGTDAPTYSTVSLLDGDVVSCVMISNDPCLKINTAASNDIKMAVTTALVPSVNIIASDNNICPNTELTFTATPTNGGPAPTYQWSVNGIKTGADSATFTNNNFVNGDIINCLMTTSLSCVTGPSAISNTITITVNPSVTPAISISSSANNICPDSSVTFMAIPINGGLSPSYQWQVNGRNTGIGNARYTRALFTDGDTVTCILKGSVACSVPVTSNVIRMNIYPAPVINMGADKVIKFGGSIALNPSVKGNIASYLWEPPVSLSNTAILSPIASPVNTTNYRLTVSTIDGCKASAKTTVSVFIPLQMPSAFTPNRDGVNDLFRIPPFIPLQITYFSVFDRWGKRIFTTNNSNNGWDGTYNDTAQPSGVYVWMIEYKNLLTGRFEKQSGTVMLIR